MPVCRPRKPAPTNRRIIAGRASDSQWARTAPAKNKQKQRRRSAGNRKLRLLRAHGLIHKLPYNHHYQVSQKGRFILNDILSARRATIRQYLALLHAKTFATGNEML